MTLMKMTPHGEVQMTADEEREFLADRASVAQNMQAEAIKNAARAALQANDRVAARCTKAGVAYPAEWLVYDESLRAVVQSGTGTIPSRPDYPAGT